MASSMLTADRRWGSTRRGGMTVLGKVAVPKPFNLPSQRLENHGLDPNVEIVPKGTLSWSSCSSSSAPNAWGSSALSPRSSDGVAGSPSWINGRPSSGGTGTRPSTAGSDRSHEPAPNVWGPSSRPSSSSSSGALASNQTLMATTRPRSAETRPGSSQLSRFAEPSSENSVAWGSLGTAEKLGAASSKVNRFTLSSGDFPSLGSEKNSEYPGRKGHCSPGRPISASGRASTLKESLGISPVDHEPVDVNAEGETANSWTGDKSSYVGDGVPPSTEKWQREPQPFPNTNMAPQHLDPWHGTPVRHSSDGVWYRGPPGGPSYGTPGPPGSYPLEPFNYYHPQVPPRTLANSQPIPRLGAGPSSYHPNNADSYRPQIPESYMRPMMPMRPGVYPGMVPYEGYYGPPFVAICNSSDRDAPVLGMAAGPCVYDRHPNQNLHHESGNFHARPRGYGSASTAMMKEQVEHSHSQGTQQRGPYMVLLKQQDGWEEKDREEKRGHAIPTNAPLESGQQPRVYGENDWVTDYGKDKAGDLLITVSGKKSSSQTTDKQFSSVPVGINVPGSISNSKAVSDCSVKKEESAPPGGPQQFPASKRNPSLINKIEGLNTKAQNSEGWYDGGSIPSGDEKMKRSRVVSGNVDRSMNEAVSGASSAEKAYITGKPILSSQERGTFMRDKTFEQETSSGAAVAFAVGESQASAGNVLNAPEVGEKSHDQIHKRVHVVESRVDNQGKGRFSTREGEQWRNKPVVAKSSTVIPGANTETSDVNVQDFHAHQEALEKSDSNIHVRTAGECATSSFDPNNYNAQVDLSMGNDFLGQLANKLGLYWSTFDAQGNVDQCKRAKMKEIATQRVKQLQKEEEERTKEQKAKALAKLEELNRRTQADSSTQKLDNSVPISCSIPHKPESSMSHVDTCNSREASGSSLGGNANAVAQDSDIFGESSNFSKDVPLEPSKCAPQGSVELQNLFVPLEKDVSVDAVNPKSAQPAQVLKNISTRQKQMGHRKKLNIPSDTNLSERPTPTGSTGASSSPVNVVPDVSASNGDSGMRNDSTVDDSLPPQKRKTHRNGKGMRKQEEENPVKLHVDAAKAKASEAVSEESSVHVTTSRESAEVQDSQFVPSADQGWSLSAEEDHSGASNQWRPQNRRMPRSQQATRSADKFHGGEAAVWAPVRPQNKNEASGVSHSTSEASASFTKNGQGMQSNMTKGKRAEMERYIPKPVAKVQQCSTERPSSPIINQSVPDEAPQRVESGSLSTEGGGPDGLATEKSGTVVEPKNGGSRHNKHGKTHGSWRQRGSTEPPPLQGSQEGSSLSSGTGKNAYQPIEKRQPQKSQTYPPKGPEKYSDNWTSSNLVSTDPVATDMKDHNITGRGKRHPFKGHKGMGRNHNAIDQEDLHGGGTIKIDTQTSAIEANQPGVRGVLKENHAGELLTSQWQPKSQPHVHNRLGNRGNGSQKVTVPVNRTSGREFTQHADDCTSQNNKDHGAFPDQPQPRELDALKTVSEGSTVRSHEVKKERKGVSSFKQCGFTPNQDPVHQSEISPANVDTQHEQKVSSGLHGQTHNNGRFSRVQESPNAVFNPAGQDGSKQHHVPANGDRRKRNSHYEYQPVGSHNNKPEDSSERAADGSRVMGSRYPERGQNHSRRGGNFYVRSSGTVRAAAGYGTGE